MKNFQYLQQKYLVNTYPNRGITIVDGKGVYLFDITGDKYLDLMTNYGANIFGYNHPKMTPVITRQAQKLITLHGSFNNDKRALAAQTLVKRCGGGLGKVYFANSGAEAVEAALKFAVLATGKKKFVSCKESYHGKTLGSLSASDSLKNKLPFEPLLWDFSYIDHGDSEQLENAITAGTAAFIMEPIQGEGGIKIPNEGYLSRVREICNKNGILLILDEIQTGVGRTGYFLASQVEDISYDILCLGKGVAGGLPVGAALVSSPVSSSIHGSIHTSTFGGNPMVGAAIEAALEIIGIDMLSHIKNMGAYFLDGLKSLSSNLISDVRGKGFMLGMEVVDKQTEILKKLQAEKILAIPASNNVVRFLPPYILEN